MQKQSFCIRRSRERSELCKNKVFVFDEVESIANFKEGFHNHKQQEKMENIDEKINKLGEEERQIFSDRLMDNLYDREWCRRHRINYVDPHILTVKEETYREIYGEKNAGK